MLPDQDICRFMRAVALWTLEATHVASMHNYGAGQITVVATASIMDQFSTSISATADGKQALRSDIRAGGHVMPRGTSTATIATFLLERYEVCTALRSPRNCLHGVYAKRRNEHCRCETSRSVSGPISKSQLTQR